MRKLKILVATLVMTLLLAAPAFANEVFGDAIGIVASSDINIDSTFIDKTTETTETFNVFVF